MGEQRGKTEISQARSRQNFTNCLGLFWKGTVSLWLPQAPLDAWCTIDSILQSVSSSNMLLSGKKKKKKKGI